MRDRSRPLPVPQIPLEIDPSAVRAAGLLGSSVPALGAFVLIFTFWRVHLMALSWFQRFLKKKPGPVSRTGREKTGLARFVPAVELLDERVLPAVTATFLPGASTLSIFGDHLDNTITVSR